VFIWSYLSRFLAREFVPLYVLQVLTGNNSTSDAGRTMKFAGIIELVVLDLKAGISL